MNKIWVIASKDVSEAFRSRSAYLFVLVSLLITFGYVASYNSHVGTLANQQAIVSYSHGFLTSLVYVLPLMYSIIICSIFANFSVILDKAKRNIESLMAAPVSIQQIWIGKSLAVTIPSTAIGLAIVILVYIVMNLVVVMPKTRSFILPDIMAVASALIVVPVLIFSIVTVVTYIQLVIANPRFANFVFTAIFMSLIFGISYVGGLGVSIKYFPLIYLGVAAVCGVASGILSRSLTKEKVLLSSKA